MVAKGSTFSRESWKVKSWEGRYSLLSMWDFKPLLNLIKTRLLGAFGLWEWGGCKYRFKAEIWCPPLIIVASRVNPRWWCHVMWDFDHDIWTYAMFWILWILWFALCKVIQESLGLRIPRRGFRIPCLWTPDSTSVDSGFHKWLDSRFQNPIFWFSTFPLYFVFTKKACSFFTESVHCLR